MTNVFGEQFQPTFDSFRTRQGRRKKKHCLVIEHDGRVWVAYYEGRGNRFFEATQQEAHNNFRQVRHDIT